MSVAQGPNSQGLSVHERLLARGPLLSTLIRGRDNNLNLIRFVAALAVLVSHSFPIAQGAGTPEPGFWSLSIGSLAVGVFFILSGLLISKSLLEGKRLQSWAIARVARLFPGLALTLALTVTVLGPLMTSLDLFQYVGNARTWTYVPRNLSLAFLQYDLPGVFNDNPFPKAVNGSIWSLFHEVLAYLTVAIIWALGVVRRPMFGAVLLGACAASFLFIGESSLREGLESAKAAVFLKLWSVFAIGILFYLLRFKIWLDFPTLTSLWVVSLLVRDLPGDDLVFYIAMAYSVIYLAYVPSGPVRRFNSLGDYSYGVYLYAFPVQQLLAQFLPSNSWYINAAASAPVVLVLAWGSWRFVEAPALQWAKSLGRERASSPSAAL